MTLISGLLDFFCIPTAPPIVPGQMYRIRGSERVYRVAQVTLGSVYYEDALRVYEASARQFLAIATLVTTEEEKLFAEWRQAYLEVGS